MVEFLLPYFLYHWGRGFLLSFLIISPPSTDSQLSPLPASPWLNSYRISVKAWPLNTISDTNTMFHQRVIELETGLFLTRKKKCTITMDFSCWNNQERYCFFYAKSLSIWQGERGISVIFVFFIQTELWGLLMWRVSKRKHISPKKNRLKICTGQLKLKKSDLSQIKKQLKNKSISMGELSRHTKVSEYILNKWFDGRTNLEVSAYRRVRAFLSKN